MPLNEASRESASFFASVNAENPMRMSNRGEYARTYLGFLLFISFLLSFSFIC